MGAKYMDEFWVCDRLLETVGAERAESHGYEAFLLVHWKEIERGGKRRKKIRLV
jgi:hypothetical protein